MQNEILWKACKENNIDIAMKYLESEVDKNYANPDYYVSIMYMLYHTCMLVDCQCQPYIPFFL